MKSYAVVSGKGGTGKTSITRALVELSGGCVAVDCDVDASNLYLVVDHAIESEEPFYAGSEYSIDSSRCQSCGICVDHCVFDACTGYTIDPLKCESCGVCHWYCPHGAVVEKDRMCGTIYSGTSSLGDLLYARMAIGSENSGKMVARLRAIAAEKSERYDKVILDGPPGIGCPVIATITGCEKLLMVVEASMSSLHDLERLLELSKGAQTKRYICINKYDINPEISRKIESLALEKNLVVAARVPFDKAFKTAQKHRMSVLSLCREDTHAELSKLGDIFL